MKTFLPYLPWIHQKGTDLQEPEHQMELKKEKTGTTLSQIPMFEHFSYEQQQNMIDHSGKVNNTSQVFKQYSIVNAENIRNKRIEGKEKN